MFVYFIQQGEEDGPIKIGYAKDPKDRLHQLQIGNPQRLKLLGYTQVHDEKTVHSMFENTRISGEWFKPTIVLFAFIKANTGLPPKSQRRRYIRIPPTEETTERIPKIEYWERPLIIPGTEVA